MGNDKIIRGTLILTMATIVSKILGLVFVVPFTAMVGLQGYILFEYAYKPYAIMISLATMGLPLAVSKFVSKYNELGDYRMSRVMLKRGMALLTVTGLICFAFLYAAAPTIASVLLGAEDGTGNTMEDVVFVIRMVSIALVVVPPMALLRGFFQGHQYMTPTAISQVVEQLIRVAMILGGAFFILYVGKGGTVTAVGFATFAAFGGAVAGMWVMVRFWKKHKPSLDERLLQQEKTPVTGVWPMFKELFSYAIPFVIVGLSIPLYQAADTFMINRALVGVSYTLEEAETVNSIVSLIQKIILIPNALAMGFALSLVPAITQSFVAKDKTLLHHQISKTFQVLCYLTFPAVAGMMMLSEEIFGLMFGTGNASEGGTLLVWYAPVAIAYAFVTVTAAILQGMNRQNVAVFSFLFGFLVKLLANVPLMHQFEAVGTVLSTCIGFGLSILINVWFIRRDAFYGLRKMSKQFLLILALVAGMALVIWLVQAVHPWIDGMVTSAYVRYVIKGLLGVAVGLLAYLFISLQTPLFREIFGQRFLFLNRFKWKK